MALSLFLLGFVVLGVLVFGVGVVVTQVVAVALCVGPMPWLLLLHIGYYL